jgi:hypothetical protein
MNGYEFVTEVLKKTRNDVGPLIELAEGHETEWLEFKAATGPIDGVLPAGESWGDYRWDVAKAALAMANGIGGALLIGVKETTERPEGVMPVGLKDSGYGGNRDEFLRNLHLSVLEPANGWRTSKEGHWECADRHALFTPTMGTLLGAPVAIILVEPRRPEDSYIALTSKHKQKKAASRCLIPARRPGDFGCSKPLESRDEADQWWRSRRLDRPDLPERFGRFDADWSRRTARPEDGLKSDPEVVAASIRNHIEALKADATHLDEIFTSLDAVEHVSTGRYDPDADEIVSSPGEAGRTSANAARRGGVLQLLEREPRAIVLGEPGAGKSTCLMRRALSINQAWSPGRAWAMLVSLSEYTPSGLHALVLEHLPGLAWVDLKDRIARQEVTLHFDALNECPAALYDACCQDIEELLRDFPAARVVVSSRFTHNPPRLTLPTFEIRPMDRDQQRRFLAVHLNDAGKASELLERLYQQPGAAFIASSPVLLRIVAEVGRDGGELPTGRAGLYRLLVQRWYREFGRKEGSGNLNRWPLDRIVAALALFAFRMRAVGRVSCDRDFAGRVLNSVMGAESGRLLDAVSQGLLLSVNEVDQSLRFSHETIQEYFAAEHIVATPAALTQDLLRDAAHARSRAWAMPIVFALELLADPPETLVRDLWEVEPLLVAAALRNSSRLASLPVSVGPGSDDQSVDEGRPGIERRWLRGVVHALRGENELMEAETEALAYAARLPKKYPLPRVLVDTLRGGAFWFAGETHSEGVHRLNRLKRLLCDGGYPWLELLPVACAGNPAWVAQLSPTQRLLVGESAGVDRQSALDGATIAELCFLLRFKQITPDELRPRWKDALRKSAGRSVDRDLICLLSMDRLLAENFSIVSELVHGGLDQLKKIGRDRRLSLRLLNLLVRDGVIRVADIRKDAGWLDYIVSRMSHTNTVRFLRNRVLRWDDIPEERAAELLLQMTPDEIRQLQYYRLIPDNVDSDRVTNRRTGPHAPRSAAPGANTARYTRSDLVDPLARERLDAELATRTWDLSVVKVLPELPIGFARHAAFQEDVFVHFSSIAEADDRPPGPGDVLRAQVRPRLNRSRNEWGFTVVSGTVIQRAPNRP